MKYFATLMLSVGFLAFGCSSVPDSPIAVSAAGEKGASASVPEETAGEKSVPGPVDLLTLERALQIAETTHPELAAINARIAAAQGNALQAGLFPNPEVFSRAESIPLEDGSAIEPEYIVGLSQSIPLGRRLSLARRAGSLEADRLQSLAESKKREIRRRVRRSFAEIAYWENLAEVRDEAAEIARNGLEVAQARLRAGDTIAADVDRSIIEVHRAELERERALSMREHAISNMLLLIGYPQLPVERVEADFTLSDHVSSEETIVAQIEVLPQIQASMVAVNAAEANLQLAREERKPDLETEVGFRRIGNAENAVDVGFSIPIPLFDRRQGRIKAAQAELSAAKADLHAEKIALESEIREIVRRTARLTNQAETMREEVLPRSDDMLETAELRYRAGDTSLADVLLVRREWVTLQVEYLETLRDLMLAQADLSWFTRS